MSNRLIAIGRIPLIPDPAVAVRAGAIFAEGLAQTDRVLQYLKDFFEPSVKLGNALRRFGRALDRAIYMRDLTVMADRELSIRGVRRDEIREFFFREEIDDHLDRPSNNRAGDGLR